MLDPIKFFRTEALDSVVETLRKAFPHLHGSIRSDFRLLPVPCGVARRGSTGQVGKNTHTEVFPHITDFLQVRAGGHFAAKSSPRLK